MLGRRVQGPWGCPCSAPLLMVNVTGQQQWCRLLQAISTSITPGTGCTLLFVCIPASVPRPLVLQLPCDTQLPPRLSPSHPDSGFMGDGVTCSALAQAEMEEMRLDPGMAAPSALQHGTSQSAAPLKDERWQEQTRIPLFFLPLFNPLGTSARRGVAVPLGHHFWEAKSSQGAAASPMEPCASSAWCPMELLEAIYFGG